MGQAFVREHATYAHRLARALEIIRASEAAAGRRAAVTGGRPSLKLEVGSGYAPHPDFDVHVDVNPRCPHLEHVGSADRLPWADGTFAELRACDVLEHFSYRDTPRVLAEWARVLAPGGRIYVQVPDARRIAQAWLNGSLPRSEHLPADAPLDVHAAYWLLGGQGGDDFSRAGDDWRLNAHYALFSPASLRELMEHAGFTDVATEPLGHNIACRARRAT